MTATPKSTLSPRAETSPGAFTSLDDMLEEIDHSVRASRVREHQSTSSAGKAFTVREHEDSRGQAQPRYIFHTYSAADQPKGFNHREKNYSRGLFGLKQNYFPGYEKKRPGYEWEPNEYGDSVVRLELKPGLNVLTTHDQRGAMEALFDRERASQMSNRWDEARSRDDINQIDEEIGNAARQAGYHALHYTGTEQYGDEWAILHPDAITDAQHRGSVTAADGQRRAKPGGERGANGEWYEGGKWIANTDRAKGQKETRRATRHQEIDRNSWELPPAGKISIYQQLAGVEIYDRETGHFRFNEDLGSYYATPEAIAKRKRNIELFNAGERWVDVPPLVKIASQDAQALDLDELITAAEEELAARPDTNVSVKAIITNQAGEVLVLEAGYHDWHDLPGGHLHQGEDIETGLRREIREETGLEVGPVTQSGPARTLTLGRKRTLVLFYTAEALPDQAIRLSDEHNSYRWVKPRDVTGLNLGVFARPVQDALADRRRAPEDTHQEAVRAAAAKIYDGAITMWLGNLHATATAAVFGNPPGTGGMGGIQGAIAGAAAGFAVVIAAAARSAYARTAAALRADLGVHVQPSTADEETFAQRRRPVLEAFPEDARTKIIASIQRGVADGEDARAIARRVKEVVGELESRGEVVAETEAQVTYGVAQSEALALAGYPMKRWVSCRDERVRDSHVRCDQQGAIPVDRPFANGLMYPGDPDGPPEEVINCRCHLEPAGEKASPIAGPPPAPEPPPEPDPNTMVNVQGVDPTGDVVIRSMTLGSAESMLREKLAILTKIKEEMNRV